jgi:hypothetical protein
MVRRCANNRRSSQAAGAAKSDVTVTMKHVRGCRMCSDGARKFFKRHNLDWNTFISEGLPEDVLIATGDEMALQVVRFANGQR